MNGFSWLIDHQLAGMARPSTHRHEFEQELAFLREQGIGLMVSLTHERPDADLMARYDIAQLHLPVRDFTPPSLDQVSRFLGEAGMTIDSGKAVVVHCTAGIGRTGTMLACYLVAQGRTPEQAINEVRRLRPGSIETNEQVDLIYQVGEMLL